MSRRNPRSTGYVAAKIRANTARRNSSTPWMVGPSRVFPKGSLAAKLQAMVDSLEAAMEFDVVSPADVAKLERLTEEFDDETAGRRMSRDEEGLLNGAWHIVGRYSR